MNATFLYIGLLSSLANNEETEEQELSLLTVETIKHQILGVIPGKADC